jgi:hypothetical protein
MPRHVMILTSPILRVADTEAGLTSGTAFQCQVTSAVISVTPKFATIASTGCEGESQSPGASAFALDLAWLQDWNYAGGLTEYSWENAAGEGGDPKWVELIPAAGDVAVNVRGECYIVEGTLGGTFGDGSAAPSTASWPFVSKPDLSPAATTAARTAAA